MKYSIRKMSRQTSQQQRQKQAIRKSATVLGTAVIACSVALPLPLILPAQEVQAKGINTSAFISEIASHAQSVANNNDLYASVMIAQAILESSWGQSSLASAPNHNLFGIKGSYGGQSVAMSTKEFLNGRWTTIVDNFRKYPSYAESFADNAYVIRNQSFSSGNYFYAGAWKSNTTSYRDATQWLTGRYATDPSYATKLNTIIMNYNLTQYDTPPTGNAGGGATVGGGSFGGGSSSSGSTSSSTGTPVSGTSYTVKAGDNLYRIAKNNGTTVANLKSWNNLTSDAIQVGQSLIVSTSTSAPSTETPTNTNTGTNTNTNVSPTPAPVNGTKYTVKAGDNLYRIAQSNGTTVANLKSWNNLSNDTIYVGQSLVVSTSSSTSAGGSSTPVNNNSNATSNNTVTPTPVNGTKYTVKAGDNLYRIAQNNGTTVANLKSWNNLSNDTIYVGQSLVVSTSSSAPSASSPTLSTNNNNATTPAPVNGTKYTVKAGDNLYRIAKNNGTTVANLKSWNNLSSDAIYVGQSLTVSANASAPSSSTSNTSTGSPSSNATTPAPANGTTYTVKAGDNLYRIAKNNGTTVANLKSWNNLANDAIQVGQSLKVSSTNAPATSAPTASATGEKTYKVKSGDTLYSIAKQNNLTVDELKALNQLSVDTIFVNQELKLSK